MCGVIFSGYRMKWFVLVIALSFLANARAIRLSATDRDTEIDLEQAGCRIG